MKITDVAKQISSQLEATQNDKLDQYKSEIEALLSDTLVDLEQYERFDTKGYTRNLVYQDSNLDVYVLCWLPGQKTPFHQHPSRGCVYKVIRGGLTETLRTGEDCCSRILRPGDSDYIDNDIGSHSMTCKSSPTVSLHFYAPSNFYANRVVNT